MRKPRAVEGHAATLAEVADWLVLTDRRVRQLVEEGVLARPARRRFDLKACVQAYLQFMRRSPDTTAGTLDYARRRKVEADAELAEMRLGQQRGELVTITDATRQLATVCERLRSRLLNIPGKYAPQLLGIRTIAEAQLRLETAVAEAMAELALAGEDQEIDDALTELEDVAGSPDGAAA